MATGMRRASVIIIALGCLMIPRIVRADLMGSTIVMSREIPSYFIFGPFDYTVGLSAPVALSTGDNLYGSAGANDLYLYFGPDYGHGGAYSPSQHYVVFDNLYAGPDVITGFTYTSNVPGFLSSNIWFSDHTVYVGIGGLAFGGGQFVDIQLSTANPVPEPTTALLLVTGVGACAFFVGRRRKR